MKQLLFIIAKIFILTAVAAFVFWGAEPAAAQKEKVVTVVVEPNQSIRDIAEKYLKNPDLWIDILRENNISSAADVKPGMTLRIPVESISRATSELEKARSTIQTADKAGAKIFAASAIDSAVSLRNQALEKRKAGEWDVCYDLARLSNAVAKRAYDVCMSKQDVPGQATLHYKMGTVQSRKTVDPIWKDAEKGTELVEREKIRTLSRSYAEILFRDESRLKLEENSQALIQEMRVNLLANRTKSNVSLIEGDFTALLSGGGSAREFQVEVPGVKTEIKSNNFRVGRDDKAAKFANYDGELGITSAGEKVVLAKNQGTVVKHNQKPIKPQNLLTDVKLLSPENEEEIYDLNTALRWEAVKGAAQYEIQIATDKCCDKTVLKSKLTTNSLPKLPQLEGGIFYWRVSAIDAMGLAGPFSQPRSFMIVIDDEPPFLMVKSPLENTVVNRSAVEISGETEKGAVITVNGSETAVAENGSFSKQFPLAKGVNKIMVEARDQAGNLTKVERTVTYEPPGEMEVVFDTSLVILKQHHFLVKEAGFTLGGLTKPGRTITIQSIATPFKAQTASDENGRFQFNIVLKDSPGDFRLDIVSAAGDSSVMTITIEIDDQPPRIIIEEKVPVITAQKELTLKGSVEGGNRMLINGNQVPLREGKFAESVNISPGLNHIKLSAFDLVGNSALWEQDVLLDQTPPKLIKVDISPLQVKGGEQVSIHVYAQDESELKKAAPFTVQVGDFVFNGFLRYVKSSSRYEGSVSIPAGTAGRVSLKKVILEDVLKNSKEYSY